MIETSEPVERTTAEIVDFAQIQCRICGADGRTKLVVSNGRQELRKCVECGGAFLEPPTAHATMRSYFADEYINGDERLRPFSGKRHNERLALCARAIRREKAGGKILDVGCAGGQFLSRFFSDPNWKRFAVEPSRFAAEKAAQQGIEVFRGELSSVDLPTQYFDVVTVLDVLNFFQEPKQGLQTLRRSLKPGGLLVAEIPLAGVQLFGHTTRIGRFLARPGYSLACGYILFYFSRRSLSLLLRESGFRDAQFYCLPGSSQPRPLQDLLYRAYYRLSQFLWHATGGKVVAGPSCLAVARPL